MENIEPYLKQEIKVSELKTPYKIRIIRDNAEPITITVRLDGNIRVYSTEMEDLSIHPIARHEIVIKSNS